MASYTYPPEHPPHSSPTDAAGAGDALPSSPAHIPLSVRIMQAIAEADARQIHDDRTVFLNAQDWKVDK